MKEAERLLWPDLSRRVADELERQRRKWGRQTHSPDYWFLIVSEELGEVAEQISEGGWGGARVEIVETIACLAQLWKALGDQTPSDQSER